MQKEEGVRPLDEKKKKKTWMQKKERKQGREPLACEKRESRGERHLHAKGEAGTQALG